ncbi:glutathione S-transferase [Nemania sp. FL0031]|nr:glutathione S-transferase [Nemania sp. FL0031]
MPSTKSLKPILVYTLIPGPNPWKVILILRELNIQYEVEYVDFRDVKKRPFIDINPNGRTPAIRDPNNNDLILWESGAIIQYIIEQYDTERILTYDSFPEKHQINQWLHFQVSGQGPYYGQTSWFNVLQDPKIPAASERYNEQLKRVLGVLESWLGGADDRRWLVGDKMTYADLAFVPWNDRIDDVLLCPPEKKFEGFPNVQAWHERMTERPAWKEIMKQRTSLMKKYGLENATGRPAGSGTFQQWAAGASMYGLFPLLRRDWLFMMVGGFAAFYLARKT